MDKSWARRLGAVASAINSPPILSCVLAPAASSNDAEPVGLTAEQLRTLDEDGFLMVRSFFSQEDLQPVIDGISVKVDRLAKQLLAAGQITNDHSDKGFTRRLAAIEKDWPGAAVLIHQER